MKSLTPILLAAALAACAPVGAEPDETGDTCGAASFNRYVGQPSSALDTVRFSQPVRIIPPDTAVTMDFNPERLNFDLDEDGTIVGVRCG